MLPYELHLGDCLASLKAMPDNSVDSIVTDPPYELGFMGKGWDKSGIANNVELWREALRVLKPGGHLLAFSGSRTYHRMTCAIEDAGFEVRDQIMWLYGSGFPKSLDVSKAIDKAAGSEREVIKQGQRSAARPVVEDQSGGKAYRLAGDASITAPATEAALQWQGWGTALKPAHEPICVARKPLVGTVAANVLQHGTGAINIDECRVPTRGEQPKGSGARESWRAMEGRTDLQPHDENVTPEAGRWPANLIHDGSAEVVALFPANAKTGKGGGAGMGFHGGDGEASIERGYGDSGSAARFFYCAKASRKDRNEGLASGRTPAVGTGATMREREDADWSARNGNHHPTVKPTELMAYLVRLVTPTGGVVLDPFMGSGSTGKAAMREGFRFIGCELSPEYLEIARARIEHERAKVAAASVTPEPPPQVDLFGA